MSKLRLEIFPVPQKKLWRKFEDHAAFFKDHGYYLAGGSALALQLGHRQSVDFDFFSQRKGLTLTTESWIRQFSNCTPREIDKDTFHLEADSVKVSFIGAYKYPVIEPLSEIGGIPVAHLADIGLMKLLALERFKPSWDL